MAGTNFIDQATTSRYKDTGVYLHPEFRAFYELLEVPVEFQTQRDDESLYRVERKDIGQLDQLAFRFYGAGFEKFWWVIALINRIADPDNDMNLGDVLRIPSRATVLEFQARVQRA